MGPGDVFRLLWRAAELDLAEASAVRTVPPFPVVTTGTVTYSPPEGIDDGYFDRNRLIIRLCRPEPFPTPEDAPDLQTQPDVDACLLAHEYGHFRSWKSGVHTDAYVAAATALEVAQLKSGPPPTPEQAELVMREEEQAWESARATLANLGVTRWTAFDAQRDAGLKAYTDALEALGCVREGPFRDSPRKSNSRTSRPLRPSACTRSPKGSRRSAR